MLSGFRQRDCKLREWDRWIELKAGRQSGKSHCKGLLCLSSLSGSSTRHVAFIMSFCSITVAPNITAA